MGKQPKSSDQAGDDLCHLPQADLTDAAITKHLGARFAKDSVYTRIGENVLVTTNPAKPLEVNSDSSLKTFTAAARDGNERTPHPFEIAANAYFGLSKFKEDQSILFVGETGSGKSENYKLCLRQIVSLAKSKKKEDKTAGRLLKSSIILDAFGNAKTVQNSNASRVGKCVEVQINSRGRLAGAKISDYLLESSRAAHVPYGERSFHVFYYMLAGASSEEKANWHIHDASKFTTLAASKTYKADNINDMSNYAELKGALKALGFKDKYQTQIFQLLASILHLGSLEFIEGDLKEEAALIKNHELLDILAEMLGVRPANLENALVYKTKLIKKEICTVFLDKDEAKEQRDSLSRTLYSLLWAFIVESMNRRLCQDDSQNNFIALVDMFGLENLKDNYFNQMLYNYTAEKTVEFMNTRLFDTEIENYRNDAVPFAEVSYGDNSAIVELFTGQPNGVFTLLDDETAKRRKGKVSTVLETLNTVHADNDFFIPFKKSRAKLFGIKHHSQDVHYDASQFLEQNSEAISADFVTLFRGGPETQPSKNSFVAGLFTDKQLDVERAPLNDKAIVNVHQQSAPSRKPSVRRGKKAVDTKEKEEKQADDKPATASFIANYCASLDELFDTVADTTVSFVISLKAHTQQQPKFDEKCVLEQVVSFGLTDICKIRAQGYNVSLPLDTFADRYRLVEPNVLTSGQMAPKDKLVQLGEIIGWQAGDYVIGTNKVWLTEDATRSLHLKLRTAEREEKKRLKEIIRSGGSVDGQSQVTSVADDLQSDDGSQYSAGEYTDDESRSEVDTQSNYGSEYSYMTSMERDVTDAGAADGKTGATQEINYEEEEEEISSARKMWLRITRLLTFWIPTRCLEWNGMKRADIQQAWREKVALCILVLLLSALMLFFITGLSLIFCPRDNMYDMSELSQHKDVESDLWTAIGGNIYSVAGFRRVHSYGPESLDEYKGTTADDIFVRNPTECGYEDDGDPHDASFNASYAHPLENALIVLSGKKNKKLWKGYLAYMKDEVQLKHKDEKSNWIIIDGVIYDLTNYRKYNQKYLDLNNQFNDLLFTNAGGDLTDAFKRSAALRKSLPCLNKIHMIGMVDSRDTPQCIFANTLLISSTGILVAIMVIKFLCALQLSSRREPEDYDRFVICQVPCYTEGEEQLRRTLDSLAMLRYDDKRKLLFIIADGNIVGSGNDRATWRIVLDILGVDPSIDPPKLSFQSLGEGNRQHNMGKIYTGLYDVSGHLIPYIVVVKVGKDSEARRPGNRGKRDSQMLLMRFLQKVHYDEPLSPLELEMYHQIKNVIGVDPSFYEFILMVDADTEVYPDSLNRMVAAMVHDAKVVGICGETTLANERDSWITMMQVYEYYISHHLAKAFESLFGSVTCLPGCFCMYRVRTPNKSIPLLIAKPVIEDYAVNNVDTLHKKNLLALGEDRYLTTLMLKHFPNMKIGFTQDAQCKTFAPDRWSVLLSQRRRWINSTVHNLAELLLLPQLCGFCCFSMRFVVFFDLFATLVMPATMAYLVYLIYEVATGKTFPMVSLILIASAYGLQVIIFMLKRKFEHIIWLLIYLLAMPFFTFIIPVYSFWHFDDFSWGNTRVVVGEKGGRKQIVDEEPFDPSSIPVKRWTDYEQEMWEKESGATGMTGGSYYSGHTGVSQQQSLMGSAYHTSFAVPLPVGPPSYTASSIGYSVPIPQQAIYPSDDQIATQIKTILATANLMTVTKKQVRDDLTTFFNVDMTPRKDFINKVIEDVLQGKS